MFDHYKRESFRLPLVSHPPKHGKRAPKDPACTLTTRSQQTAPDKLSFLQRKLALIISFFCNDWIQLWRSQQASKNRQYCHKPHKSR